MPEDGLLAFEAGSRLIGPVIDLEVWDRFSNGAPLPTSQGGGGAPSAFEAGGDLGTASRKAKSKLPKNIPKIKDAKIIDLIIDADMRELREESPMREKVITDFDRLLTVVEESGDISSSDAAKMLNIPLEKVEKWARILENNGLLILDFPFMKEPILRSIPDDEVPEGL